MKISGSKYILSTYCCYALQAEQVTWVLLLPVPVWKLSWHLKDFNCCISAKFWPWQVTTALTFSELQSRNSCIQLRDVIQPSWSIANNWRAGITGSLGYTEASSSKDRTKPCCKTLLESHKNSCSYNKGSLNLEMLRNKNRKRMELL